MLLSILIPVRLPPGTSSNSQQVTSPISYVSNSVSY
jgi:hypothetical protein